MDPGNGLVCIAPGVTVAAGDSVDVLLFDRGFEMREVFSICFVDATAVSITEMFEFPFTDNKLVIYDN